MYVVNVLHFVFTQLWNDIWDWIQVLGRLFESKGYLNSVYMYSVCEI